jgi:hypothetical protein
LKRLFALLLACSAGVVAADPRNPCGAPASATKVPYVDLASTRAGFQCAPFPVGDGTFPTFRANGAGTVAWWYCPSASGNWQLNWAAATAASLSARNVVDQAYAVMTAADPKAAFHATVANNVKLPLSDPSLTPVWCPFVPQMISGAPAAAVRASSAVALQFDPNVKASAIR